MSELSGKRNTNRRILDLLRENMKVDGVSEEDAENRNKELEESF